MNHTKLFVFVFFLFIPFVVFAAGKRDQLEGLVYEVEDWSSPQAWKLNQPGPTNWNLWTKEEDCINKRSNGQTLTTPPLPKDRDRETPEDGAPALHTKITGIPNGLYTAYVGPTNRPLAFSMNGKTWEPMDPGETNLGVFQITDGTFELWVDDRLASPANPGWAYYDYIRLVPAEKLPTPSHVSAFTLPDGSTQITWLTDLPTAPGLVVTDGKTFTETETGMRNHRVVLTGLEKGKKYTAQVGTPFNRKLEMNSVTLDFTAGEVPVPAATRETSVLLTVTEPTDAPRSDWPLTSGVPFPKGVLASAENVKLFDESGKEIPAQFEKFADWEDGSVKWLTVTFRASTRAKSEKPVRYTLKTSASFHTEPGVSALSEDEMKAFGTSLSSSVVFADGTETASKPSGVRLTQQGAQAATIQSLNGSEPENGEKDFRTGYEITFFGKDFIRIRSTLLNAELETPHTLVRSASVFVPCEKDSPEISVLQETEKHAFFKVAGPAPVEAELEHWDGMIATPDGAFCIQNAWQTWPKGMTRKGGKVGFHVLPELPNGYAPENCNELEELMTKYYWLKENCYQFKRGMEIRSDFWIVKPGREVRADWLQNPLFAVAEPEYYCACDVFPPVHPAREGKWEAYETAFRKSFEMLEEGRNLRGEYGWMNFGDWFGERKHNWGNNEYDLAYVCALGFIRTGDPAVLQRGIEAARHYTTVDHKKLTWTPNEKELQYTHCYGHVNYFFDPADPRVQAMVGELKETRLHQWESDRSGGHDFQPGAYFIACLTGDHYTWNSAFDSCWMQAVWYTPRFNFSIERAAGWPLNNAVYSYKFTHNPYFLNAARLYLECIEAKQNQETGCFDLPQDQLECDCPDKKEHRGGKPFAVGILTHALIRAAEELPEGEERAKVQNAVVRCADWLLDYAWNEEKGGFRYKTGCPKYEDYARYTVLTLEAIGYAGEVTQNPRYKAFLNRTLPPHLSDGSGSGRGCGKDFSQRFRQTAHALYYLEKH